MPLLWRYLIKNFFKIFLLCVCSFLSILIILRAQNVAKFAAENEGVYFTIIFILLQLPYILPFATALSALLSSFLVTKQLNDAGSLSCLRSFGLSFKEILFPIYCLSFCLGFMNFLLISEICPFCKRKTKELLNHSLHNHPLSLLDDAQFQSSKHIFSLSTSLSPFSKKDILIVFSNSYPKKLSAVLAKELSCDRGNLLAKNVHIFTSSQDASSKKTLLESYDSLKASIDSLIPSYRKYHQTFTFEELSTKKCLIKLQAAEGNEKIQGIFEILKRLFFLITPIAFVFLGTSSGIRLGRETKSSLKILIVFTLFVLASYFLGKSFEKKTTLAAIAFFLPQSLLFIFSYHHIRNVHKGISS